MKEFKYVVTDPEGIHARPAGILVKQAAVISVNCQDHKRREDSRRKEDLWRYGTGC